MRGGTEICPRSCPRSLGSPGMAAPDFELADPEQRSKEIAQLGPRAGPFALRGVPELRSKAKRAGLVGNGTVSES